MSALVTGTLAYLLDIYGATMTTTQAAEVLHNHPSHVRALCQAGELPAVRIGKRWFIPTAKLAEMLEGGSRDDD